MRKTCTKCKHSLDISEFYANKRTQDGLNAHCKQCAYALQSKLQRSRREWADYQLRNLNLTGRDY